MKTNIIIGKKPGNSNVATAIAYVFLFVFFGILFVISYFKYANNLLILLIVSIFIFLIIFSMPLFFYEFWEINNDEICFFSNNIKPFYQMQLAKQKAMVDSYSIFSMFNFNKDMLLNRIDTYTSKIDIKKIKDIEIIYQKSLGTNGKMSYIVYLEINLKDQSRVLIESLLYGYRNDFIEGIHILKEFYDIPIIDKYNIMKELESGKDIYEYLKNISEE